MAEGTECGLTLGEEIDQNLSGELVDRIRTLIGAQRDEDLFRDRLVHVLKRYYRYLANTPQVMRMERRKQLSKLHDKARSFLTAMNTLHPEVRQSLEMALDSQSWGHKLQGFDVFDLEQPLPEDDDCLDQAQSATSKIVEACLSELDTLNRTKSSKRGSRNPALDQLLIDLAALYEAETNQLADSQCYRDETSVGGYGGMFFNMAKAVLDANAPGSYDTPAALGIRILRVLEDP